MKLASRLLITALLPSFALGADWIRLSTPNFEVYASRPEEEARETLEMFEEARVFFSRATPVRSWSALPVTLVIFGSAKEYQPYSPGDFKPAYFAGTELRDYIVMGDVGDIRKRAAIHEYVHLLVSHSGLSIPQWLNEGMADVYSTLRTQDGRILVGATPADRAAALASLPWLKMSTLMNVSALSPEYNEIEQASVFYGQSWLLAHMLLLDPTYRGSFSKFLERISATGSSQSAFSDVYNKSLADIEKAMNIYFRRDSIGAQSFDPPKTEITIGAAERATEVQTGVVLATLSAIGGKPGDAIKKLEPLSAAHPESIEAEEMLSYAYSIQGNRDAALEHLEEARARGRERWRTDWEYARMFVFADQGASQAENALRQVLKVKPDMQEARMLLAVSLLTHRDFESAWDELQQIRTVPPNYQILLFVAKGAAADGVGRADEARRYIEDARKRALRPGELQAVDQLLKYLQPEARPTATSGDSFSPDEEVRRPVLKRAAPPKPASKK